MEEKVDIMSINAEVLFIKGKKKKMCLWIDHFELQETFWAPKGSAAVKWPRAVLIVDSTSRWRWKFLITLKLSPMIFQTGDILLYLLYWKQICFWPT